MKWEVFSADEHTNDETTRRELEQTDDYVNCYINELKKKKEKKKERGQGKLGMGYYCNGVSNRICFNRPSVHKIKISRRKFIEDISDNSLKNQMHC